MGEINLFELKKVIFEVMKHNIGCYPDIKI